MGPSAIPNKILITIKLANPAAHPVAIVAIDHSIITPVRRTRFDNFWAINSRRDFKKAVRAMILAAIKEGDNLGGRR